MEWKSGSGRTLRIETGDITRIPVDAIVNAANSGLRGGGGVDGAIHRAGGPTLMAELDEIRAEIGHCPTGSAVVTGAGRLPAKYVFHAVGPVYRGGRDGEAELLASCYKTCLALAEERNVNTISFPAISTGVYGYPLEPAARIAIRECRQHLENGPEKAGSVKEIILVLYDDQALRTYLKVEAAG